MKIAVLGTGIVGHTIAGKLTSLGHEVTMGARQAGNDRAAAWAQGAGSGGREGSFADAARFGEIIFNATNGDASLDALRAAGRDNLAGKIIVDVANPIAANSGMPPVLSVCNTDSLGEQIQRAFPDAHVVKTLNTVTSDLMVEPDLVSGPHVMFVCGNDAGAKTWVTKLLGSFGWPAQSVYDLGDISSARGTEMYLALWLRLMMANGTGKFNIAICR